MKTKKSVFLTLLVICLPLGSICMLGLLFYFGYRNIQISDTIDKRNIELKIIGIMLANTDDFPRRTPGSFEEFEPLLRSYDADDMKTFNRTDLAPADRIKDGTIEVVWNKDFSELQSSTPSDQIVVAYERGEIDGRYRGVLFLDTSTKRVTSELLSQLLLAQGSEQSGK
jgi:hypothetical protein